MRKILADTGFADNTLVWLTSDNGPESDCKGGFCTDSHGGPGEARPLRGRKRDYWEGGHRVPGIIEFPPLVNRFDREKQQPYASNHTVVTTDLLPTLLDLLNVSRWENNSDWALDGRSVLPLLRYNYEGNGDGDSNDDPAEAYNENLGE